MGRGGGGYDSSDVSGETTSSWRRVDLFPYLYLLSVWGGGVTLRSESDSDTGLRGREAEEVGRDVDQVGTTGEDRGFGSVDTPDRDLEKSNFSAPSKQPGSRFGKHPHGKHPVYSSQAVSTELGFLLNPSPVDSHQGSI